MRPVKRLELTLDNRSLRAQTPFSESQKVQIYENMTYKLDLTLGKVTAIIL